VDPNSESGSGSRRAKMAYKSRKTKKFMFLSAGCSLLRAWTSFMEAVGIKKIAIF
jgi:hypothetical protein